MADLPRLPELVRVDAKTFEKDLSRSALLRRRWALPALECLHIIGQGELRHEWEARVEAAAADARARHARRDAERDTMSRDGVEWRKPRVLNPGHADGWDTEDEVAWVLGQHEGDSETEEEEEWFWDQAIRDAATALTLLLGNIDLPALRVLSHIPSSYPLDAPALAWRLPLTLAGLQHLVLRVADDEERSDGGDPCGDNKGMLDTIAGGLPALRTLYVEASGFCIVEGGAQLLRCRRLEALALVNVHVEQEVAAPPGCRVATALPLNAVGDLRAGACMGGLRGRLDALALRRFRCGLMNERERMGASRLDIMAQDLARAALPALRELRIVLDAGNLWDGCQDHVVALDLGPARLPALRVLEVDVPCTLRLRLARALELRTLVLVAHALAGFAWEPSVPAAHPWAAFCAHRGCAAGRGPQRAARRVQAVLPVRRGGLWRGGGRRLAVRGAGGLSPRRPARVRLPRVPGLPGPRRRAARGAAGLATRGLWQAARAAVLVRVRAAATSCAGRGVLPKGFLLY